MNSPMTSPGGVMSDIAIIDEFADAISAEPLDRGRVARATSALLENLVSRATTQSAGAFVVAYERLTNEHNNLRTIMQFQADQLIDHEQRLHTLELERGDDASD